ncbi:MAG: uroporphyrinogen III synthase HEM4 [SAR86 cluster bacterium]|uniref:Uroporphyrinogen III synthase HEM4 n=1 Tax=SAR86 cluster bacterium TaxID=2030880 RepID=A0A2A4XFC8_9GAMM|nr:MAG: uroporphyrinogen III synthase HEM4 [SAR86 cluster bacterium]
MSSKPKLSSPLASKVVALSESRQLDVLASLCERRQATVIRIPLISIEDSPDQVAVLEWVEAFVTDPPDYLIILTGEGLRRLLSAAKRHNLESKFVDTLAKVCKICRGPKPARVLKEIDVSVEHFGTEPTTTGIIEALESLQLEGARVGVQLYGEDPNQQLMDYLTSRHPQGCSSVSPYIYRSNSDAEKVEELILKMFADEIDFIAFTSMPQVRRLFSVADKAGLRPKLMAGLAKTKIAAVGPVVAELLDTYGCEVSAMPASSYFMKPLVRAMEAKCIDIENQSHISS